MPNYHKPTMEPTTSYLFTHHGGVCGCPSLWEEAGRHTSSAHEQQATHHNPLTPPSRHPHGTPHHQPCHAYHSATHATSPLLTVLHHRISHAHHHAHHATSPLHSTTAAHQTTKNYPHHPHQSTPSLENPWIELGFHRVR